MATDLEQLRGRPTCSAEEAIAAIGCARTTGYSALREGTFPVPAFKVGARWYVPTRPLLHLLGEGESE